MYEMGIWQSLKKTVKFFLFTLPCENDNLIYIYVYIYIYIPHILKLKNNSLYKYNIKKKLDFNHNINRISYKIK